jgi:kinesin family protein 6/9
MEIYNENAYDLLDKKHLELPIEQWNKVKLTPNIQGDGSARRRYKQHQA